MSKIDEIKPNYTNPPPRLMTIDEAYEHIGRYGTYQKWVCVSSFITMVTCMMYVFSIPLLLVFPKVNGCTKPGTLDTLCQDTIEACAANVTRVYPNRNFNFISEFDLPCDDISSTSIVLSFVIGSLTGSFLFSMISDNYGRLRVLLTGQIGQIVCLLIIIIAGNYHVLLVLSGICGFFVAASGTPTYAFAYDSSHTETIKFHGTYINLVFAIGEIIVALLLWTQISWRIMLFLICIWSSLFFFIRPKLIEPPKFLLSKNRNEEALSNLQYISQTNGVALPENIQLINQNGENEKQASNFSDIIHILAEKSTLCRLLMCMFLYFSCGFIYYGISMNIQRYKGNIYANAAINGLINI